MSAGYNYISQIEGHARITFEIEKGRARVQMEVHEGCRLFEEFLRGRRADEVAQMSSRICGVCPVVHNYAAIMAIEKAMGIQPSAQTEKLRRLGIVGQMLQSHALHLYFLALPEYLGAGTLVELYGKAPEAVKRALRVRAVGNDIVQVVSGRAVHPVNSVPGGFMRLPSRTKMAMVKKELKGVLEDCVETYRFAASLAYPELHRKTEYSALDDGQNYPAYGGRIVSDAGVNAPLTDYKKYLNEAVRTYSTAKFSHRNGHGFFVGAISRVNLFHHRLLDRARELAGDVVKFPSVNPFHNLVAQGIELVHYTEEGIELAGELAQELKDETVPRVVRPGWGVGATEAPRGTLFHAYRVDEKGIVTEADIVTPTAQNLTNIEEDLTALLNANITKPRAELVKLTESLLRAYDPCFSCSTH
ncbi:MAG: Ni/Fe hydrogenase subunit alpha [Thermoplasmata archaeon]